MCSGKTTLGCAAIALLSITESRLNVAEHDLSKANRRRFTGCALSLESKMLIAEEPTSALDVSVHARVFQLIQSLQKQVDFACLFITHDLAVIDVLADRIAVMHHGRIVKTGTRDEILRYPKDPYTQRLLATAPFSDPAEQRARRELRRELLAAGIDE